MTLAEWETQSPYAVREQSDGAKFVPDSGEYGSAHRCALWHLSDYLVSSVTAGAIWLVPRAPVTE